jgi:hypothetical protein
VVEPIAFHNETRLMNSHFVTENKKNHQLRIKKIFIGMRAIPQLSDIRSICHLCQVVEKNSNIQIAQGGPKIQK